MTGHLKAEARKRHVFCTQWVIQHNWTDEWTDHAHAFREL